MQTSIPVFKHRKNSRSTTKKKEYAMSYNVTLITGDGVGPEIADATRACLEATGVQFNWDIQTAGIDILEKEGTPLPERVLESIRKNKVAIKAPITTPVGKGFRSVNVALRKAFDLYACVRPCKSYPGVRTKFPDTNLVIIRENTEDLYAGIEFKKGEKETLELIDTIERLEGTRIASDAGISIKPITVEGTRRIVQFAFDYARQNGRKKVTAVHKANIMKFSDGLYLEVAREVAKKNSDIEFEDRIVDNMCMQLIQWPEMYDVLVLPNLYGDIVSDLCAGLVGGLGMAPGGNIGKDIALFEATHGSAPKYAGLNKVNPSALILSGVLMLRYLGEKAAADKLENAVAAIIKEGKFVTYDLKPEKTDPTAVGTQEMAQAIIKKMSAR
jgi:isocitrate dehydrogenase (NAD+)